MNRASGEALDAFTTRTLIEVVLSRLGMTVGKARLNVEAEDGRFRNLDHGFFRVGADELARYDPPEAAR
jgi:hypothetical protein